MPKCYQLIGVPCAGKSTWTKSQEWIGECAWISTDQYVEEWAESVGKTYSEVFEEYMPTAVARMVGAVNGAKSIGKDIVWDQTSTTVKSRLKKFKMLPDYEHIAVVFTTPSIEVLKKRLANRPGKEVPWDIVQGMIDNFEFPTEEEGFQEIWRV
jgi:predicted kinase